MQAIATVSDAGSRLGGEFGAQLAEGAELYHELAARGQQVTEQLQVIVLGRGRHEAVKLAEAGQHGSVDAVVLGELSEGLGEAPRAQRVDQHGLQAGLEEALMQTAVIAPGGLEDSAADAVLQQPVAQGAAAALVILEVALQTALEDVGVEPGFADIDTGDYGGLGWCHSCVPVLLRYGATPTLPLRSRRNCATGRPSYRTDLKSEGETVRPVAASGALQGPRGDLAARGGTPAAAVACATCGRPPRTECGVVSSVEFEP